MIKTHTPLLRCATIGKGGEPRLLAAAKHNLRETSGHGIDSSMSHRNVVLAGPTTARAVTALAATKRDAAGIVLKRKDATLAAEFVFSLAASAPVDADVYFRACLDWVVKAFGEDAVLSAAIHKDQGAPHAHVLIQPVKHGSWLSSSVFGRRQEIKEMQDAFFRDVALCFGLQRAPARLAIADKRAVAQEVLLFLKSIAAPGMQCLTWPVVRDLIELDPVPFAEQLGIPIKKRLKTLAELKVSPGKGSKHENTYRHCDTRTSDTYPVVGVAQNQESQRAPNAVKIDPGTQSAGTQSVRSNTMGNGGDVAAVPASGAGRVSVSVSTRRASSAPPVSDSVSAGQAILRDSAAPQNRSEPTGVPCPTEVAGAAPEPVLAPPERFAGRLGLYTLRDQHKAMKQAPAGPQRPSHSSLADVDGTTRERDRDLPAGAWDEITGQFRDVPEAETSPSVLRVSVHTEPDPESDFVRCRDVEAAASDWDSDLGEHVRIEPVKANRCRLLSP